MASRYKKSKKNYFTQETEDAIIEYNNTDDYAKKSRIYGERIHYAFFKLTQNIIHTFKFYHTEVENLEHLQQEVIIFLLSKMDKYNQAQNVQDRLVKIITKEFEEEYDGNFVEYVNYATKIESQQIKDFIAPLKANLTEECFKKVKTITVPKAYSYFGTITKRWLINYNNKNYKKKISKHPLDDLISNENYSYNIETLPKEHLSLFINQFIDYVENNFDNLYKKDDDKKIADAILELFRKRENIDIFHKQALYKQIRETLHISGIEKTIKSPKITKIAESLYEIFEDSYIDYIDTGLVSFEDI